MALDFGSTACGLNYVYLNTSIYLQHNSQRQPITQSSHVNESSSEVMVYLLELGIREARTLGGRLERGRCIVRVRGSRGFRGWGSGGGVPGVGFRGWGSRGGVPGVGGGGLGVFRGR